LVDDYDIVVMGVAQIPEKYRERVVIAELDTNQAVSDLVDIVLYDSFAQPESDHDEIRVLIAIHAPGELWSTPARRRFCGVFAAASHPTITGSNTAEAGPAADRRTSTQ
jgi:hypothetical protein